MSVLELLSKEIEIYRHILLNLYVSPCRSTHIQNPMMKDSKVTLQHQYDKKCKEPTCINYHLHENQRRPILTSNKPTLSYSPVLCTALYENFLCHNNHTCQFSHSESEVLYHLAVYKTEPCSDNPCPYGSSPWLCHKFHSNEASRQEIAEKYRNLLPKGSISRKNASVRPLMNVKDFKVHPCGNNLPHDKKLCPYYHNDLDRRRSNQDYEYCPELCPHNYCASGAYCRFSRNKVEQLYHSDRYKKKFCEHFPYQLHKCEYGDFCSFAHSEEEIRKELLHKQKQDDEFCIFKFKTIFCPFKNEHDRSSCPYAHNIQDYRRSPELYSYEPEECEYWNKGDSISSYEQAGCAKMLSCLKCHGWKEYEYHPLVYKTRPCNSGAKCRKKECVFYHSAQQKRIVNKAEVEARLKNEPSEVLLKLRKTVSEPEACCNYELSQQGSEISPKSTGNQQGTTIDKLSAGVTVNRPPGLESDSSSTRTLVTTSTERSEVFKTPKRVRNRISWSPKPSTDEKETMFSRRKPLKLPLFEFNFSPNKAIEMPTEKFHETTYLQDTNKSSGPLDTKDFILQKSSEQVFINTKGINEYNLINKLRDRGLDRLIPFVASADLSFRDLMGPSPMTRISRVVSMNDDEKSNLQLIFNEILKEEDDAEISSLMSDIDRFTKNSKKVCNMNILNVKYRDQDRNPWLSSTELFQDYPTQGFFSALKYKTNFIGLN